MTIYFQYSSIQVHNKPLYFINHFLNEKCKQIIKTDLDDDMVHVQHKQNLPTNFEVTKDFFYLPYKCSRLNLFEQYHWINKS